VKGESAMKERVIILNRLKRIKASYLKVYELRSEKRILY